VQDPDGDLVQITVTDLTQSDPLRYEPCSDAAGIGSAQAEVRAVRDDRRRGRVYHVSFQADDGRGGQCAGRVTACVPGKPTDAGCLDDGSTVSSLNAACTGLCAGACGAERALGHVSCSGERVPTRLARAVGKARRLMVRAAKGNRSAGAIGAALRTVERAVGLANDAEAAGKISPLCATAIDQVLGDARTRMEATSALAGPTVKAMSTGHRRSTRAASQGHASRRRAGSARR
jgi:hypothetical protein